MLAVAELAVTKCLADRGDVDPEAPLLDGYVRPRLVGVLAPALRITLSRGRPSKIDQHIQCPTAEGKHGDRRAPEHPSRQSKVRRAESQHPVNYPRQDMLSGQITDLPAPYAYRRSANAAIVRALKLATTKLVANLNLGYKEPKPRAAATTMDGQEACGRHDRCCGCASSPLGADCTKISRQITDRSFVGALCDAECFELHRRWPVEAALSCARWPLMQCRQKLRRAPISLCAIPERSECNSGGRSHRTAWADSR